MKKIITKSGISLNAGTSNRGFTVYINNGIGATIMCKILVLFERVCFL
jgi:hypothetical protein